MTAQNPKKQSLSSFLDNKTLFYKKIDYDVISQAWEIISSKVNLPYIIHIVGTNGKGSTGRYLASFLTQLDFKVLHYSSPHIIKFNERIWINGEDSSDEQLDFAHQKLQSLLPQDIIEKLTYFEYTTLLAFILSDSLDYLVLEAGLGGEFDATNVVKNDLTLVTTIGLDHTEFLGDTIVDIAKTKMRSCDKAYIIGKQVSPIEVEEARHEVLNKKEQLKFQDNIELPSQAQNLPKYLKSNLKLVLSALEYLNLNKKDFKVPELFGRCQNISENITIDVGHNSLAATVLLRQFANKKITLVYNSYKDKDYNEVLQILKPILDEVNIIKCDDERMIESSELVSVCNTLSISVKKFEKIDDNKQYLIFGSFKVVEEFLREYKG